MWVLVEDAEKIGETLFFVNDDISAQNCLNDILRWVRSVKRRARSTTHPPFETDGLQELHRRAVYI